MQKENQTTAGATYTENFAFIFVGCLISHDKRFFETLHAQMLEYQEVLLESSFMDDRQERVRLIETMQTLNELTQATRNLDDQQLNKEFKQVLNLMGFKKESEVASA